MMMMKNLSNPNLRFYWWLAIRWRSLLTNIGEGWAKKPSTDDDDDDKDDGDYDDDGDGGNKNDNDDNNNDKPHPKS